MKKISMTYKEYQDDLNDNFRKGYSQALRDAAAALKNRNHALVDCALEGNTDAQKVIG